MEEFFFLLITIFVTINIIQTWLIFTKGHLAKKGILIGFLEAIEFFLMFYLFLEKELLIFSILVITEISQWISIAYLATKD